VTDPRVHLRALADALPEGSVVPVPRGWLLELLVGAGQEASTTSRPVADMTVAQLAIVFGRRPSAVRAWLERGDFPGAYKFNDREWRVPPAAVEAFQERQRRGGASHAVAQTAGRLTDWRRVRGG
jgi:hypothetical protein